MMSGIKERTLTDDLPRGGVACLPRVLVVCRSLGRASEVWLHRQIAGFERLEPTVLCWERENRETYPLPGIDVTEVSFEPSPQNGRARWWWRLRNLPGGNFYATIGRERHALTAVSASARPDLMLCQFGTIALRMLPVARELKLPLVAHFHGVDITSALNNPWYRSSLKREIDRFAAMVVVADYQREILLTLGGRPERIHVIPCGVPVSATRPPERSGKVRCGFLAVGRLVEKKAPEWTLKAFARCVSAHPDARLTVIGEGPLLEPSIELAEELGITGSVEFLGSQPSHVVAEHLEHADVFVQHSVTPPSGDREGWPVSVAEAMAAGLPVVATRHAGIVQQVDEGRTGYLVDERDWEMMGRYMTELAGDPGLRVKLGQAARRRAERDCDQRVMVARLEEVLLPHVSAG